MVVDAPQSQRRAWIKARNGWSDSQINEIFDAQASAAERLAIADDILHNDADIQALRMKIDELHARYLELAARKPVN